MSFLSSQDRSQIERYFLSELTDAECRTLRKLHPFRKDRDALIRDFYARGISVPLLLKVSGLSESHINRIVRGVRKNREN